MSLFLSVVHITKNVVCETEKKKMSEEFVMTVFANFPENRNLQDSTFILATPCDNVSFGICGQ